jgi:D-galactonate transporter
MTSRSTPTQSVARCTTVAALTKIEEDAIWSKINWRVMPIILIAYITAFLDRINVGYAKLSMQKDLHFSDQIYGLGAGIFFLTYLVFEVPSNLWLEKIGARLSFMRIMVLWGLTSAATAWVTKPWHFYSIRLLLGMFEAGFFPGIILYLTYWYPSHRRGRVTGLFLFGMPIAGVLGGPVSGMIMSRLDGVGGWRGWQWVFVLEGVPTVLLGVLVYLVLSDKPEQASWLSDEEKSAMARVLEADHTADAEPHHHGKLRAAFRDPKTFILAFVFFACACAAYSLTFWLPTIVQGLGIKNVAAIGWYTAIPFACGAAGVLLVSRSSDYFRERRWHVSGSLVIGSCALYATTFIGNAVLPAMVLLSVSAFFIFGAALFWSIPPTYLSREAAAAGIAVISSLGIVGGFVSPFIIGWVKASTGRLDNGLLFMTVLICLGGVTLLVFLPKSAMRVGVTDECDR